MAPGLNTGALITDMNEPLATAAGNGLEVRNAVDFLTGAHQDARLKEVTLALCAAVADMTGIAAERGGGARAGRRRPRQRPRHRALRPHGRGPRRPRRLRREHGSLPARPRPSSAMCLPTGQGIVGEIDTTRRRHGRRRPGRRPPHAHRQHRPYRRLRSPARPRRDASMPSTPDRPHPCPRRGQRRRCRTSPQIRLSPRR